MTKNALGMVDLFEDIVEADNQATDKRRASRIDAEYPVVIHSVSGKNIKPVRCKLYNLSESGVCLKKNYPIKEEVHLGITIFLDNTEINLVCRTVFCHQKVDKKFYTGAEIIKIDSASEKNLKKHITLHLAVDNFFNKV